MAIPIFQAPPDDAFHKGMLLVKVRPQAPFAGAMAALVAEGAPTIVTSSIGLSAMAAFERAGRIVRVRPVARPTPATTPPNLPMAFTAALAVSTPPAASTDPNAGVSIVELGKDQDVAEMQAAFAADPSVEYAVRVPVRYLVGSATRSGSVRAKKAAASPAPAIPALAAPPTSALWNLSKIEWARARARAGFVDATNIRVAVLDTGIQPDHQDLQGQVDVYQFTHPDLPEAASNQDIVGHGSHVAGTIAAMVNAVGVNGVCDCSLRIWKIFTDAARFIPSLNRFWYVVDPVMYLRALGDCVAANVHVVNLSIGRPMPPTPQESQLFQALIANGTTVVAAMGNERQQNSPTSFPAAIPGVIAVGATAVDDTVANFSNRGTHISLCAPGVGIWSTLPTYAGQFGFELAFGPQGELREGKAIRRETSYDAWDGTSMASPHVAAAAALLLAKGLRSPQEVRDQLMSTADKVAGLGGQPWNSDYGAGRLNLFRLLA